MSVQLVRKAVAALREATAEAVWAQWSAIFSIAASKRSVYSIVDPEALLFMSLYLRDYEPRVWSAARVWAQFGSRLLSVQRAKNLRSFFPEVVGERLSEFAMLAVEEAADLRWQSIVAAGTKPLRVAGREREGAVRLEGGAALVLRLRLGIGVGIKADLLAYLLGQAGAAPTVQRSAKETHYHLRAVRRALEELAGSGLIDMRPSAPVSYRLDLKKWAPVLSFDPNDPPAWRSWVTAYGFVAAVDQWARSLTDQTRYVLASEARTLIDAHARELDMVIRLPPLDRYRGEAYLEPFIQGLRACVEFMQTAV